MVLSYDEFKKQREAGKSIGQIAADPSNRAQKPYHTVEELIQPIKTAETSGATPQAAVPAVNAPQTSTLTATPQSAATTAPLTQGSLAGEGRSAEQVQQEITDSRKELARLKSDAAYILTAEPGAELGRQMDEVRARIKALNTELDALKTPNTNAERESLIQRINDLTANEGYATTVELADAVTREKQETRQRLHQLDEELGNAARFYDSGERAPAVIKGALKQTGSAYTNFMGTLQGVGNRLNELSPDEDAALYNIDYGELAKEEQRLYEKADTVAASAAKDIEQAKEGLSALGKAGVDISVNLIQNGIDAAAKAAGLGMAPFFVRAAGGAMQEARQAGASTGQQVSYGISKAVTEVATELLSGGIAGTGISGIDKVVEPLIDKLAKSTAGKIALNAIYDAAMEGGEEVISDLLDPFAKLIYNDQALKEAWENRAEVGAQMLYDYLIGAAVGSIGSGTKILTGTATGEVFAGKPVLEDTEAQTEVQTEQQQTGETTPPALRATSPDKGRLAGEATPQSAGTADRALYTGESTTPQSAPPTAPLTRGAMESAPLNVQQETQTQVAETAQETQRATAGAETPPATQNAAQTASGELNTQVETNTQGKETPGVQNTSPVAQNVAGGTVVPRDSTGTGDGGPVLPHGAKMSQFWENTLQKTENDANAPDSVKNPLWYMPKSEAQSLAEAASRLGTDEQGTIENLVSAEAWSGVQTDAAAAVADTLYAEGTRTGDYSSYAAWRKVMQNHITDTARGLQSLAKYTRTGKEIAMDGVAKIQDSSLSPEQKTAAQNKIAQFGDNLDTALADKDVGGLRELILKMNEQRGTGTFVKGNFAKVLGKIDDVEYLGEYARRQLSAVSSDYTASETRSFGEVLKTWQVNSQLTSLGTFFRNIGGNLTFGAIDSFSQNGFAYALDSIVSKKTGKRTVAADKGWFSSEARKQAIDAMNRSILEVAGDVDMGVSATRYGTTSGRTFKMSGGKAERFMSRWEQLLGYSLQTSDRLSRGQIEGAVQSGLEGLKNSGLSAEEISQIAGSTADYRLFQNEGTAAKLSKGAHDVLNILGIGGQVNGVTRQGGFGVGDLVNPYPKVPANLGVKALEYSPANIIKGGIELVNVLKSTKNNTLDVTKQHQAVMDIARGLAGTPIIMLCAAMLKTGLIKNFDDEEDYDVQAQNAAEGKTGVQINLDAALRAFNGESTAWRDGDDLMSISWAEPLNAFMAIGSLIDNEDDDATINTYIGDYFNGALQSVLDMPLMSNLSGAIDTVRYSAAESLGGQLAEGALDYAVSTATGFIPSPFRQSARAIDPYYRNTAGDNKVETAVNTLLNAIPGLRLTLDPKLDNFGQPKENAGGFAQRALNALVLPGAVNELNQSDASATVEAIYEATGDAGVYPDRKAPNSISSGKNKHSLTAEEKQNYQAEAGQTSGKLISSLAESKYYDRMSDEQKAEVVKAINQYAEHKAADQIFDILGIDTKRDKWETLKGDDLISYLTVKELVSGMYDDDGKITDYSAADKLIGQIKSGYGDLSTEAKDILKSSYGMLDDLIYGQENGVGSKEIYTAKEKADVNGNGSITQEELWNYLGLQKNMPARTKSVLWDILTTGKTGYSEYAEKHK